MASSGNATITLGAAVVFGAKHSVSAARFGRRPASSSSSIEMASSVSQARSREGEQADHGFAGRFHSSVGEQRIESARISAPGKDLIAIDEIEQRMSLRRRE